MAIWSRTVTQIQEQMRAIFRRVSGKDNPCYTENLVLVAGFNQGCVELAADMRRENFHFMESAATITTTADMEGAAMADGVFAIIPGSVRCVSEDIILYPINASSVNMIDADRDERDVPNFYWIQGQEGNVDNMVINFYPTPDNAYDIQMQVLTFPDADSIAGFPGVFSGLIKDKALSIALPDLGFFNEGEYYRNRSNDGVSKFKKIYDDLQPEHIKRSYGVTYSNNLQTRAN
jgi:hypothetical protein